MHSFNRPKKSDIKSVETTMLGDNVRTYTSHTNARTGAATEVIKASRDYAKHIQDAFVCLDVRILSFKVELDGAYSARFSMVGVFANHERYEEAVRDQGKQVAALLKYVDAYADAMHISFDVRRSQTFRVKGFFLTHEES